MDIYISLTLRQSLFVLEHFDIFTQLIQKKLRSRSIIEPFFEDFIVESFCLRSENS